MIRLLVIEDHLVTIAGIRSLFRNRDGISITASTTRIDEALKIQPGAFDVILLDLWMQSTDPVDNVKLIKEQYPGKPIVIFTSEESRIWQEKMRRSGVSGYILKTSSRHEIKTALEYIIKGQSIFAISSDIKNMPDDSGDKSKGFCRPLTSHQLELVKLMATGVKQRDIASALHISQSTVEKIIKHLREKYSVKTNTELIRFLTENRLI